MTAEEGSGDPGTVTAAGRIGLGLAMPRSLTRAGRRVRAVPHPAGGHTTAGSILVLGAPRSGTTWLGKIFDSHPDVLYRHEPDSVSEDDGLPWICPDPPTPALRAMAAAYFDRLAATATVKTAAVPPFFPKHHRDRARRALHLGWVGAVRGLRALPLPLGLPAARLNRWRAPDLIAPGAGPTRIVVKSVSSHGRARAFADALPDVRLVLILRDPFGYVCSVQRGAALGKFPPGLPFDWIPDSAPGRRHGLTEPLLASLAPVELVAWTWVAMNELLCDGLAGRADAVVLRYDDLCTTPEATARAAFAATGLSWSAQTEGFLAASTGFRGPERYYGVLRDAARTRDRWRAEMASEDQRRVAAILRHSPLAAHWPDLAS